MIIVVTRPLAVRRSVPSGSRSAGRNGSPTRIVTWPPGCGIFWPFGQTRFEPEMPIGTIGAPVRMARTAIPSRAAWSDPSGLRVPSGKTNRIWPSSRIRDASRNASMSAAPRSTGWTPPCAAVQPMIGQANSSFLPSQWMRRPSFGISHEPITTASRFEAWFAARMTGPSRGIWSMAPVALTLPMMLPKTRPPVVSAVMRGVIELSIGSGASLMRWRCSVPGRGRRRRRRGVPRRRGWR